MKEIGPCLGHIRDVLYIIQDIPNVALGYYIFLKKQI